MKQLLTYDTFDRSQKLEHCNDDRTSIDIKRVES